MLGSSSAHRQPWTTAHECSRFARTAHRCLQIVTTWSARCGLYASVCLTRTCGLVHVGTHARARQRRLLPALLHGRTISSATWHPFEVVLVMFHKRMISLCCAPAKRTPQTGCARVGLSPQSSAARACAACSGVLQAAPLALVSSAEAEHPAVLHPLLDADHGVLPRCQQGRGEGDQGETLCAVRCATKHQPAVSFNQQLIST